MSEFHELIIERPFTPEALRDAQSRNPALIWIDEFGDGECTLSELYVKEFKDFERV